MDMLLITVDVVAVEKFYKKIGPCGPELIWYLCHDLKEILWVPNFYYICQICYLRLGLRSSGFVHDRLQAPFVLIVIRVVQSTLMNL